MRSLCTFNSVCKSNVEVLFIVHLLGAGCCAKYCACSRVQVDAAPATVELGLVCWKNIDTNRMLTQTQVPFLYGEEPSSLRTSDVTIWPHVDQSRKV